MLIKTNNNKYLKMRFFNKERKIEIGIYPVLYGWRVQAGIIDSGCYEIDYCCGNKKEFVEWLLAIVKFILEKYDYDWKIFPIQYVKPIFNDFDCFSKLLKLIDCHLNELEKIKIPDLNLLRYEIMQEYETFKV